METPDEIAAGRIAEHVQADALGTVLDALAGMDRAMMRPPERGPLVVTVTHLGEVIGQTAGDAADFDTIRCTMDRALLASTYRAEAARCRAAAEDLRRHFASVQRVEPEGADERKEADLVVQVLVDGALLARHVSPGIAFFARADSVAARLAALEAAWRDIAARIGRFGEDKD